MHNDVRLFSPSAARNCDPILQVLRADLPPSGIVLEIASGTGQHVGYVGAALPALQWQPTDPMPENRASIDAWTANLTNVLPAIPLDAINATWPIEHADAVLCINMIHIAPWAATEGLVGGPSRVLASGGLLALVGPFRRAGKPMEPGNAAFDADLRYRDPLWGLREVETVAELATDFGFGAPSIVAMPTDNLVLLFRRRG
jgi:hypothetical protein